MMMMMMMGFSGKEWKSKHNLVLIFSFARCSLTSAIGEGLIVRLSFRRQDPLSLAPLEKSKFFK